MMDFIGEIQKIEKEIEKAVGDATANVIDELQAIKKQLEKEMQQSFLKTDVAFKTNSIVTSQKHAIQKNKEAFHDICKSLSEQGIALNKSFESKTGSAVKETLHKHLDQIRNEMISIQYDLINSCGKK
ncbi:hypothetical protein ACS2G7_29445 [Bacillus cereus group sp. BceL221]|uniref:hypothetical protein n=1 Tax=unclassified Bacillus cereus group TaxID=2750818 RepID=UPI000975F35E|nr:hypothetical protein [Bacillus cereus group sp. Bc237]MDA2202955.1 hypothetical protein [Bacillus cereus group sp. Bc237]ONG75967.1 hypothetical protein BKK44_00665 [Bacillus cereus]